MATYRDSYGDERTIHRFAAVLPKPLMFLCLGITVMGGCASPYAKKLSIDYSRTQIPGSIVVSDAKLYRREALINERRREVRYIDQLMANTEKDGFVIGPEIDREIEVIRAIALSAGLSFDPAAGRTYRDSVEKSDIQQDIDALKLQLQLDQLKRDAELFRAKLATQTEPSRTDVGAPTAAGTPAAAPTLTPADSAALVTRIDALQTALVGRLGAEVKGPRAVTLQGNPIDQFRDRAAYRQILTTARNAASLDELHDLDGAALYRLTFQVTTLPPPQPYLRTAGIVEMRPVSSEADTAEIYSRWLDHINQTLVTAKADDPARLSAESLLAANDLFGVVQLLYDLSLPPKATGNAKHSPAPAPKAASPQQCGRLLSYSHPAQPCGRLAIAVPALPPSSVSLLGNRTMEEVVDLDINRLYDDYDDGMRALYVPGVAASLVVKDKCELRPASERAAFDRRSELGRADTIVSAAVSASTGIPLLAPALRRIATSSTDDNQSAALAKVQEYLVGARQRASVLLRTLSSNACAAGTTLSFPPQTIVVPEVFRQTVEKASGVRVYEVGPREQVQQVSTAARAAEAFSLALAVAAKAPSAGNAGNAGLGFSRSAVGKVDAVERLPIVVGFTQAAGAWANTNGQELQPQSQFGWILGPRVNTLDAAKGTLDIEQGQKIYDLSADLAVSGWRTRLTLAVRTAWAPDWNSANFVSAMALEGPEHFVTVDLRPSPEEFDALTTQLAGPAGHGQRFVSVRNVRPGIVKACAATTLVIEGENLWRATDVIVGGQRISGDGVAVLPDMRGLTVEIPAKTSFADAKLDLQVLTSYGVARSKAPLVIDGYDPKGCDKPDATEGPAVTALAPEAINRCSSPTFRLTGRELDKLTVVRLGGQKGTLAAAAAKAKEREVSFTSQQLAPIATESETLQFFAGDKAIGTKAIRLVSLNCGNGDK